MARYLLDQPAEVAGKRVLDFATGSGLVAIAAMKAGAASVLASDIDLFCEAAVALNAEANGVQVAFTGQDLLAHDPPDVDAISAGDICYEWPLADRVRNWLQAAHRRGTRVLIGDPGRAYLPREGLRLLARYEIETTRELEDREVRSTGVFHVRGMRDPRRKGSRKHPQTSFGYDSGPASQRSPRGVEAPVVRLGMGARMADYRLHYLDSRNQIVRSIALVRDTDEGAIETAARYASPHGTELWGLNRLLHVFEPTQDSH